MTSDILPPPPLPVKRPGLVWLISLFYFFSVGSTVLSYLVVFSGMIPTTDAQKQYFAGLSFFDHALTFLIVAINLAGAISLFLLRKRAFRFFLSAFAVGILTVVYQIIAKNWLSAVNTGGIIGTIVGWIISIAIIVYTKRLIAKGVLK